MTETDLRKKTIQPALTDYPGEQPAYTTGAYIRPAGYIGRNGKWVFGWMVTGFEGDTYRDGKYLDVKVSAGTPAGLTPGNDEDKKPAEEAIKKLLGNYWSDEIELEMPLQSSSGNIVKVTPDGVYIENREDITGFSALNEDDLFNIAWEAGLQIEANEKAFEKSQSQR